MPDHARRIANPRAETRHQPRSVTMAYVILAACYTMSVIGGIILDTLAWRRLWT